LVCPEEGGKGLESAPQIVIEEPKLADLLDWWDRERAGHTVPPLSSVDPTRIPVSVLPHVAVMDPPDADSRIHVRLTGSQLDLEIGLNITGKYLDEFISGENLDYLNGLFATVVEDRVPVYSAGKVMLPNKHLMLTRRLMLPFGTDSVERVMVGQTFVWVDDKDAGNYALVLNGNAVIDHKEFRLATGQATKTA